MFMLRSTHRRILAEGQERARETIAKAMEERDAAQATAGSLTTQLRWAKEDKAVMRGKLATLRAEVERLTPKRDARGHFVKGKGQ